MSEFGISVEHLHTIADTWQREGSAIRELRFALPTDPAFGCASLNGLLRCAEAAGRRTVDLGTELDRLGAAVRRFNTLTQDSDSTTAAEIAASRE